MKQLHIAALGSSFASGPGIKHSLSHTAMRSSSNYPHLLAEMIGARLTDHTVSGATLNNISSEPQRVFLFKRFPPQIEGLSPDVDIVTITAGGNDLGYDNAMFRECLETRRVAKAFKGLVPSVGDTDDISAQDLADRFVHVIDAVRERAPNCLIVLVEYFTLLGPETKAGVDICLTEEQIEHHKWVADKLSDAYEIAGKSRHRVEVIPMRELSMDHCLGSEDPWVENFSLKLCLEQKVPFHPNARAMEKVAECVYGKLLELGYGSRIDGEDRRRRGEVADYNDVREGGHDPVQHENEKVSQL